VSLLEDWSVQDLEYEIGEVIPCDGWRVPVSLLSTANQYLEGMVNYITQTYFASSWPPLLHALILHSDKLQWGERLAAGVNNVIDALQVNREENKLTSSVIAHANFLHCPEFD
jgi:hypothetical protein